MKQMNQLFSSWMFFDFQLGSIALIFWLNNQESHQTPSWMRIDLLYDHVRRNVITIDEDSHRVYWPSMSRDLSKQE